LELDEAAARVRVTDTRSGSMQADVLPDGLPLPEAEELALALAPLRDAGAQDGHGVPERVSLLDLLEVDEPDVDWLLERWSSNEGLGAPLGAAAGGPFTVDLRTDGPHGLIAGTTGAGKSELLQSLIASLAASHPPSRL